MERKFDRAKLQPPNPLLHHSVNPANIFQWRSERMKHWCVITLKQDRNMKPNHLASTQPLNQLLKPAVIKDASSTYTKIWNEIFFHVEPSSSPSHFKQHMGNIFFKDRGAMSESWYLFHIVEISPTSALLVFVLLSFRCVLFYIVNWYLDIQMGRHNILSSKTSIVTNLSTFQPQPVLQTHLVTITKWPL